MTFTSQDFIPNDFQNVCSALTQRTTTRQALTWYDAGEQDAGDSLEEEAVAVVAGHSEEEGFFGWQEVCDVPDTVGLAFWIVANGQYLYHATGDAEELQLIGTCRTGQACCV